MTTLAQDIELIRVLARTDAEGAALARVIEAARSAGSLQAENTALRGAVLVKDGQLEAENRGLSNALDREAELNRAARATIARLDRRLSETKAELAALRAEKP